MNINKHIVIIREYTREVCHWEVRSHHML